MRHEEKSRREEERLRPDMQYMWILLGLCIFLHGVACVPIDMHVHDRGWYQISSIIPEIHFMGHCLSVNLELMIQAHQLANKIQGSSRLHPPAPIPAL